MSVPTQFTAGVPVMAFRRGVGGKGGDRDRRMDGFKAKRFPERADGFESDSFAGQVHVGFGKDGSFCNLLWFLRAASAGYFNLVVLCVLGLFASFGAEGFFSCTGGVVKGVVPGPLCESYGYLRALSVWIFHALAGIVGMDTLVFTLPCVFTIDFVARSRGDKFTDYEIPRFVIFPARVVAGFLMVVVAAVTYVLSSGNGLAVLAAILLSCLLGMLTSSVVTTGSKGRLRGDAYAVVIAIYGFAACFGTAALLVCHGLNSLGLLEKFNRLDVLLGSTNNTSVKCSDRLSRLSQVFSFDVTRLPSYISEELVYAMGTRNFSPAENQVVSRLALVGDRVASLALSLRTRRECWTVESNDVATKNVVTNAAFARWFDRHLLVHFPTMRSYSQSRKATLVEMFIGVAYLSGVSLAEVEVFLFSQVSFVNGVRFDTSGSMIELNVDPNL